MGVLGRVLDMVRYVRGASDASINDIHAPEKMRMVRVPERKLFSAPSGGFGVTEREGMGVTEREPELRPPFSFVSFDSAEAM